MTHLPTSELYVNPFTEPNPSYEQLLKMDFLRDIYISKDSSRRLSLPNSKRKSLIFLFLSLSHSAPDSEPKGPSVNSCGAFLAPYPLYRKGGNPTEAVIYLFYVKIELLHVTTDIMDKD